MDNIIVTENLTKHYKKVHAVRGINLTVRRGEIFGLVGPDGAGKTTTMQMLVAIGETAVAIGLILGLFSNLTNLGGTLLALVIWSTAEGFGGSYQAGSTDIGAAVIYVLVFVALFLTNAGLFGGLDRRLTPALGRWGILASGTRS